MNLYTLDLDRTEDFLRKKFPSVRGTIRRIDQCTFTDTLEIWFRYDPVLKINLEDLQYKNGGIFYDYIEERVIEHLAKSQTETKQGFPEGLIEEIQKHPPIEFDLPKGRLINEAYPDCDPNYKSKVWNTVKTDFIKIVDFLFPISFIALNSLVFFLLGFILAFLVK